MTDPVEREAKLILPEGAELPPLGSPGTQITPPDTMDLHTTYWDTPDRALASSGRSLRYRRGVKWTAKREGQASELVLDRPERHFDGDESAPPAEAVEFLEAGERASELEPVVVIETRRERRNICPDGSDTVLVEVVDDTARVSAPDGHEAGGFREVELEVMDADGDPILDLVLERVRGAGIETENAMPKYQRALRLLGADSG